MIAGVPRIQISSMNACVPPILGMITFSSFLIKESSLVCRGQKGYHVVVFIFFIIKLILIPVVSDLSSTKNPKKKKREEKPFLLQLLLKLKKKKMVAKYVFCVK